MTTDPLERTRDGPPNAKARTLGHTTFNRSEVGFAAWLLVKGRSLELLGDQADATPRVQLDGQRCVGAPA
jgi:hypothetical protein